MDIYSVQQFKLHVELKQWKIYILKASEAMQHFPPISPFLFQ